MGRAAKLAALKLRVSRAGRALLGLAPGSSGTRCERSNTSQLSARRRKLRANAGPARGSFSFASIRTSSQLLRLQVLRVGRAAKLAALKLRISRAGRALLGLAPGSSGKPQEAPGSFRSWETRAGGPAEVFLKALSALALRALKHIAVERGTTQSRKFRANAGPTRCSVSFALIQTSSQLLRLQVLRVGRAAKLAALKLRVSRAGAPSGSDKLASGTFREAPVSGSLQKLWDREASGRLREALREGS